jgi:hypothetical protein
MKVAEAKKLVLNLIDSDLRRHGHAVLVEPRSPDPNDPGKFLIDEKPARVIYPRDGHYLNINPGWFDGSYDRPNINGGEFHWYVFAIPRRSGLLASHYSVCEYLQIREWVLEFAAPLGIDHRDHHRWRADVRVLPGEQHGYFRWGDEDPAHRLLGRIIGIDNIGAVTSVASQVGETRHVGAFGVGGESEAHRRLKLYVAKRPDLFRLSPEAESKIEHQFCTGDRVDVLYNNHGPQRSVIEVELDQPAGITIGVHQAIKYRALAASEGGYPIPSREVAAWVVAYGVGDTETERLARAYDVSLLTVTPEETLANLV